MALVEMDLTKADVIPDGTYVAKITGAEVKTSQNSGNQYINWTFFIPDASKSVFHITSFKAAFAIKKVFDASGTLYTSSSFNTDDCLGKDIRVTLSVVDDPQYGVQNKVAKIEKA